MGNTTLFLFIYQNNIGIQAESCLRILVTRTLQKNLIYIL